MVIVEGAQRQSNTLKGGSGKTLSEGRRSRDNNGGGNSEYQQSSHRQLSSSAAMT
jgi:hypothetical protein